MSWRGLSEEERLAANRDSHRKHLAQLDDMDLLAKFRMSNMAAGPCDRAKAFEGELFDPEVAPIPPFEVCPHPGQCGCLYEGFLDLTDD